MSCKKQYGVIPYVQDGDKIKFVIITSRTNSYWIFPKGNLVKKKDKFESACQEAWEEAGVTGVIDKKVTFAFDYQDHGRHHKIKLYPMKVEKVSDDWPEKSSRKRKVVSPEKAVKLVEIDGFAECLKAFVAEYC